MNRPSKMKCKKENSEEKLKEMERLKKYMYTGNVRMVSTRLHFNRISDNAFVVAIVRVGS